MIRPEINKYISIEKRMIILHSQRITLHHTFKKNLTNPAGIKKYLTLMQLRYL